VSLDVNETIGALTIGSGNATLNIFGNQLTVTNAGGGAGTVTVTAGNIAIGGGTLSATNGLSVASGSTISGVGTLIGTIAGAGKYQALGGTLRLESAVLSSATGLQIANSASILELDSTVASGAAITFAGAAGTLDLTDISGNLLQGFSGTIAGLNVGTSATVPTNQIDLAGLATANITATSLNTSTDVLTVTTTGGSFALQLSGSYAASTRVGLITDGAGTGTDLFLVAGRAFSWNAAVSGNWSTAADWTPSGGAAEHERRYCGFSRRRERNRDLGCQRDDRGADDRRRLGHAAYRQQPADGHRCRRSGRDGDGHRRGYHDRRRHAERDQWLLGGLGLDPQFDQRLRHPDRHDRGRRHVRGGLRDVAARKRRSGVRHGTPYRK